MQINGFEINGDGINGPSGDRIFLKATLTETSRLSGAMNMPIRIRTGIMRAIQIPFHGEVVS